MSVELANRVGLIEEVKGKLIIQRDPEADYAAGQLAAALAELNQIFGVAEWALGQYSSLYFYNGQDHRERRQERTKLLQLESGAIQREGSTNQEGTIYTQMKAARTHCHKIRNIYDRFLASWFDSVLDDSEKSLMFDMFMDFGSADDVFSDEIEDLADWLSQQAGETLKLLDDGRLQEANQHIMHASVDTRQQRDAIRGARDRLSALQADFTQAAAVVE